MSFEEKKHKKHKKDKKKKKKHKKLKEENEKVTKHRSKGNPQDWLFEDEDAHDSDIDTLKINHKYAKKFADKKKAQHMSKCKKIGIQLGIFIVYKYSHHIMNLYSASRN